MRPSCKHCLRDWRQFKPKGQKFKSGDKVFIAEDLGPSMEHFTKGVTATVVVSAYQIYAGGYRKKDYLLCINGEHSSWYEEHQLTLVRDTATDET